MGTSRWPPRHKNPCCGTGEPGRSGHRPDQSRARRGRIRRRNPSRCRRRRDGPARREWRSSCGKPGANCGNRSGTLEEPQKPIDRQHGCLIVNALFAQAKRFGVDCSCGMGQPVDHMAKGTSFVRSRHPGRTALPDLALVAARDLGGRQRICMAGCRFSHGIRAGWLPRPRRFRQSGN